MPVFGALPTGGPAQYAGAPAPPTDTGAAPGSADLIPGVIDGTPIRLAFMALAAAGGLYAFKLAGFRFTVTAST